MVGIYKITNTINDKISKLTIQDIKDIRNLKKLKNKRMIIYERYKDKISNSAFNAIWYN